MCNILVTKHELKIQLGRLVVGCKGGEWISFSQDTDQWQFVVNVVMKLAFHQRRGISFTGERLSAFEEGLCATEFVAKAKIFP